MPERETLIDGFLHSNGWRGARRGHLAGDASFRRYQRLEFDGRRAVLMDAPPPQEDVRPFMNLANHLRGLGYSAPQIYASDPENGLLLLEDLGDLTYMAALDQGESERALYDRAVDLLVDLHGRHIAVAVPNGLEAYGEEKLLDEVALLTDWYMPQVLDRQTAGAERSHFLDLWRRLLLHLPDMPDTLVLRDFHADNLMWLPERPGIAACGLLDFQDAIFGSPVYDLLSLLEDARRDLTPGLAARLLDRYFWAMREHNRDDFERAYAILGAQRHCKVIGIFTRLAERDGKYQYLLHIPRVWQLLDHACRHPDLAPLKTWMDEQIPLTYRQVPVRRRQA